VIVRRLRRQEGLTLIEMLMATALSAVVFMVLYTILGAAIDAFEVGQVRSSAVQGGRVALSQLVSELRYARTIYIAGSDQVNILRLRETAALDSQVVHYRFDAANGTLTREEDLGGALDILDDVTSLSFTYRDASLVSLASPQTSLDEIRFIEVDLRLRKGDYVIPLRNVITLENPLRLP
jgi:prepilin-type N-terminal cleavage/methylation domain-containing protein